MFTRTGQQLYLYRLLCIDGICNICWWDYLWQQIYNIAQLMKDTKVEFILFLDPTSRQFYSYCPSRGLIVEEEMVPSRIMKEAQRQIDELHICMEDIENKELTSFQRRPIPLNLLSERKFKYPVYFTEQYLPASALESYKVSEAGQLSSDTLYDFISAKIYLGELQLQLERSKKGIPPDFVTIDIKLIASVNEIIRTINRVILQDYGVVITMRNSTNKLIFKIKDKNQYLYGNESIVNFQFIRESLSDRKLIQLEILQVSVYDKEQYLKYIFNRNLVDVNRGQNPSFPWDDFIEKNKDDMEFLMWHMPDENFTHPETFIDIEKLYSNDELVRTNEKIKLKMEEKKRLQVKKIPKFLWKEKISQFIEKRRAEIKNRYVEIEGSVIYSGECFFAFQITILALVNFFSLFRPTQHEKSTQNRFVRKRFLRFQSKQMFHQGGIQNRLPSVITRYMNFVAMKRKNLIDILPYMMNITVQFALGNRVLYSAQTKYVLADNHQAFGEKISWSTLARMPLQTTIVFKVYIFAKEGDGDVVGVGALKLFDESGFMVQGEQDVQLYAMEKIEMYKIGCIDKYINDSQNIATIKLKLPKFKHNVLWTLSDLTCAKMLGYQPQIQSSAIKQQPNLQRLNQLLRCDPLTLHKYSDKDKELLRKCKKYYKHQSEKLVNYLFAVDWTQPAQVAEAYATLNEWAALKPTEALFLLTPNIVDQKVRYYAVKRMQNFLDYQFVLYSNQITQALVSFETDCNPLIDLIIEKCVYQPYSIGQQYFWQFKNRFEQQFTARRFQNYLQCLLMVSSFRKEFSKQVRINNSLVEMNEKLIKDTQNMPNFKDKNKKFLTMLTAIENRFNQICPDGFLFPIRPQYIFKAFNKDECKMFDSKKLPFSLSCIPHEKYKGESFKIMFKYGDDLKQDNLVLQMFRIFDKLWRQNGLDFKMNIYRTLSTGTQIGFIQLVDAENNSKIHKDYGKGLVEAFDERTTYLFLENHNKDKKDFSLARQNYLRSSAGYLVATYILGIGDRHSGNVMVQRNGKFFHIDFGHILGNFKTKFNIKRERTPVLFTSEFLYVMGTYDSKEFARFQDLCAKAYNILRKNAFLIVNLLAMMVSAEIPQLKKLEDIEYVTEKMALQLSDAQAAQKLINTIKQTLMSEKSRNIDNAFHEANRQG